MHHQRLGLQIGQIEVEFIGAIGRVERCGGRTRANRDKGRGHFRAIGQYNRNTVIAANANAIQPRNGGASLVAQPGIGKRRAARRADGRRGSGAVGQKGIQGCVHASLLGVSRGVNSNENVTPSAPGERLIRGG